jgi:hypothetical protein
MSSLDQFLAGPSMAPEKPNVVGALRKLAANKDLRIFLTSLCKYSKADWASLVRACRILSSVLQSSILIKQDSAMMDEIAKVPHIAMFFRRITEEDV